MLKTCLTCGKEFKTYFCRIKIGWGKFCSRKCYSTIHRKKYHHLPETKQRIGENNSHYWKGKKRLAMTGKNNWNWKGGKFLESGYWFVILYNYPYPRRKNYVFEHRLVAEKYLGRYLLPKERIHHINEIRTDNRPENLYLFSSDKEHMKFHGFKNPPQLVSNIV